MSKATGACVYPGKYEIMYAEFLPITNKKKSFGKDYNADADMLLSVDLNQSLANRNAIQVWEKCSVHRAITKTIVAPDDLTGFLNITFIKNHPEQWAITSCKGYLCLLKPHENIICKLLNLPGDYGYHDADGVTGKNILLPIHGDLAYIMLDNTCEHAFLCDLVSVKKYSDGTWKHRVPLDANIQYNITLGKNDTIIGSPEFATAPISADYLAREINTGWLLNATHFISAIHDLKYNSVGRTASFLNLMRTANRIGDAYGRVIDAERCSQLVRAIFLFTSQAEKYVYTMLLSNESSNIRFDIGLWDVRVMNLAYVFSTIFLCDYNVVFKCIKEYQSAIIAWVFSVFSGMVTESEEIVHRIFECSQKLSGYILIFCKSDSCHQFSEKQLRWFQFAYWLQRYKQGNKKLKRCSDNTLDLLRSDLHKHENWIELLDAGAPNETIFKLTNNNDISFAIELVNLIEQ